MLKWNNAALRLFAAGLAMVWCLLFVRCDTTDKSMVRAVLLQKDEQSWTAGFLYQAPEAAADASEAAAKVAFCAAKGQTLQLALAAAEQALPQQANYRLCDYVLLACSDGALLAEYEQAVLESQCGRLSAYMLRCSFTSKELLQSSAEMEALPEKLLQCVKQAAGSAPRLYEHGRGLLLPVLALNEDGAQCESGGVLWDGTRELALTADQMQAALLLAGKSKSCTFQLAGQPVKLTYPVCSLTLQGYKRAVLRVDCQTKPGTPKATAEQKQALQELLCEVTELFWENGVDLPGLGPALALQDGSDAMLEPAKNACLQLQADVQIHSWL